MDVKEKTQGFSVKDKKVCIVGCGGLGTNIAVHLAGAGVGKIYLCDFDKISESNLNRQFFFTQADKDKVKCEVLRERLSLYAADTEFVSVFKKIDCKEDLSFAKDCEIIICAVDNTEGRIALEDFAQAADIPVVFGGIDGFYGTAYLYIPKKSPCPDCAGVTSGRRAEFSVSASAGIIGSMQANLALRYVLTKDTSLSGKIFLFDGDLWETLPVISRKDCKKCNISEVIK